MYTKAQLKAAQEAQKQAERSRLPWPVERAGGDRVKSDA